MLRRIYICLLLALPFSLFAQEWTITGTVLDGESAVGEGLIDSIGGLSDALEYFNNL